MSCADSPKRKKIRLTEEEQCCMQEDPPSVRDGEVEQGFKRKKIRLTEEEQCCMQEDPPSVRDGEVEQGFEYLDHPADVQLHAWGPNMKEAIEQLVYSMYNCMTDMNQVEEVYTMFFTAKGHDMQSLIFSVLEEPLVAFQSEPFFIGKNIEVIDMDLQKYTVSFKASGESFYVNDKHTQETDVKAITYSNMQINRTGSRSDIYVIVDV